MIQILKSCFFQTSNLVPNTPTLLIIYNQWKIQTDKWITFKFVIFSYSYFMISQQMQEKEI